LADGYLTSSKNLKRVFVLADCRVESAMDKQLIQYLYYYRIPFTILASKADKLKKSEIPAKAQKMAAFFGVGAGDIIPVSYLGMGKDKVLTLIEGILESSVTVEG
ncbi:MAG: hypothetical protein FWE84_05170, partial [Firmicutes bacterium]|nr:hypothetical protein [Bacillota bacterium]